MKRVFVALFVLSCYVPAFAQDGKVVVYRPKKYQGSALKPSIYVDGKQAARLGNGRFVSLQLAPGKHNFDSSMKKAAPLEVDVKSKETVYLEMVILTGNWRGGGRLIPVGEDEAKNALVKLKPLDEQWVTAHEPSGTAPEQSGGQVNQQPTPPAVNHSQAAPSVEPTVRAQSASVAVKSTPSGADINVDGKFMGSTPSTIQLPLGEHAISIEKEGLRPWQRRLTVTTGGSLTIDATLEKP